MNNRGISLIELVVVTAVIAILAVALGFTYSGWRGAYNVEKTTKDIFTALTDARGRAVTQRRAYFVDFPTATTYRMAMDDSNGTAKVNDGDATFQPQVNPLVVTANTDTTVQTFPKVSEYTIVWNPGGTITFDRSGIIIIPPPPPPPPAPGTVCLTTIADADYDCIEVTQTRINLGKLTTKIPDGGACATANCIAK
ncbi:MAG: prepilin-type N-terminal cleavage/methylation domain-containing protein [Nitrospirae bacterium]|nr:prepilin-type N-terminal cleavage/methylation domain-containing protein [Nitrospirota bacterium]